MLEEYEDILTEIIKEYIKYNADEDDWIYEILDDENNG